MSNPTVITDSKVYSENINSESSNNGENRDKTTTSIAAAAEVVVDPPAVATAVTEENIVELPATITAPAEEVAVGPPTTITPSSPVVTTKSKINTNGNISNSTPSSSSSTTPCSATKEATTPTAKPLTVTVNGNDRSKDLNEHDVVCEKGRGDHERWPGNKLYRHLINVNKETYNDLAPIERSNIIGKIIGTIQEKNGWFVSHSEASGNWSRLTEEKVRKKVSDDLRREVRRRREKRSHNSLFSAKLRQIKEMEEVDAAARDILERVDDPRQSDVLFGPGARRHPGNKTYWHHMKLNLDQYIISPYGARSVISRNIVQIIRNQHGRFLEQDPKTGIWYSISDKRALEKTSHALSNMKYKTRKRHPDEPPHMYHTALGVHPGGPGHQHQHQHHLAYQVGPYGEEMVYGDEMEDENILEGDSPNTIFAKKRTKKFRLLNRMDDGVVVDQMTPLKGNGSNDDNATPTGGTGVTEKNVNTSTKNVDDPTTTPVPGLMKEGKVISPNSGSDSIDYQEQRNPNNYRRVQHMPATGMPNPADGNYGAAYRGVEAVGADIAPRISHFDYMKHYAPPPGSNAAAFKTLTYAAGAEAYGAHHGHPPPHPHHMRRYLAPNLAAPEQQHGVPPPHVTNGAGAGGTGVPQGGGEPSSSSSSANNAHEAALAARRRVLKATGPAGYWVSNEWAPPPPPPEAYY